MRITKLKTENIGGLHDALLEFPNGRLTAVAGANGTGKSRLLACLMSLWTGSIPSPADRRHASTVTLEVQFSEEELDAIVQYDRQSGWNQGRPPATVEIVKTYYGESGVLNLGPQEHLATFYAFQQQQILSRFPSLNAIYLPAERSLVPTGPGPIDLNQLADDRAQSALANARSSAVGMGQLSDSEFESYARALCVAASLPNDEDGGPDGGEADAWARFRAAVDQLIYPKALGSLTRQNPTDLRIEIPGGSSHGVGDLSSGERQALIIISRVFRASSGYSLMVIDEPDVHLHPALSSRLVSALDLGMQEGGQLIMATHSPAILDGIPPESIIRLTHSGPASTISTESDRLELYRSAGFRASALTQSSMLLVVEGDFDSLVLPKLIPALGAAFIRNSGGRDPVLKTVSALADLEMPILGVIDADVGASPVPTAISSMVHSWDAADLEGVLLSDDEFLQAAIDGALIKPPFATVPALKAELDRLLKDHADESVIEVAVRQLREKTSVLWPSPRGDQARSRLDAMAGTLPQLDPADISEALSAASQELASSPSLWPMVRGKWIASDFVRNVSNFKNSEAFFLAVIARQPVLAALNTLSSKVQQLLDEQTK
ncbi:ATP-binding protein [Klenkia brasiliensis]|uniref:Predicted ATP-dependent endonuclease of the OLD family, contains P-loop ATPase and TOPRIM domains n=1 Tax=Klenkia brasiliensis TaxID=333142 RepID=A0A1G7PUC0_9ACTN|nr:ATP-binding protein [Klenkia brasiliensis]SDF89844.1 Predicted ATP-dependent endonuclease of the OLD family, contains P-loop ATPase and TOPRIM domains [Klenkia brasiliensis]